MRISYLFFLTLPILAAFIFWPQIDLAASGLFYHAEDGFIFREQPILVALHEIAFYGARVLGVLLVVIFVIALLIRKPLLGLTPKAAAFLFIALIVGPGLVANLGFKDHWGRARPREIVEFGGEKAFSPALIPQANPRSNGSFVSGDAAFGFYLPAFAFVVPLRTKRNLARKIFWCTIFLALLFSFARLAMGAHFLSDIVYAAVLMLAVSSGIHAAIFTHRDTAMYWRHWLFQMDKKRD